MLRYRRRKKRSRLASFDGEKAGGSENDGRVGDSVEICDEFEKMGKDTGKVDGVAGFGGDEGAGVTGLTWFIAFPRKEVIH